VLLGAALLLLLASAGVRATLARGVDATSTSRDSTVPPQTKIDSGPSGPTNNPTPVFTFSSSKPGSSFACRIDSSPFAPCKSPRSIAQLAMGAHTFRVRATDAGGTTDPTPASRAFTVQAAPNVLVIETDDQTLESMRIMNNVNSLIGADGVTFQNNFVNFSLCCPSRATFLTGQYAHNHGVLDNKPPNGGFDRFESLHGTNNLAVWLKRAGYYTALIGKYLNHYSDQSPVPPGWSEWDAAVWHPTQPDDQSVYRYTLNENGTLTQYGDDRTDFKQDVFTNKAVDFVNRRAPKAQPFFLWLTYTAPHIAGPNPNPHAPYDCLNAAKPPQRYAHAFDSEPMPTPPNFNEADVSDKPAEVRNLPLLSADQIAALQRKYRCQLESLLAVDDGVKKVLGALQAKGELGDTLIIYTSDNGYFNGEHRIPAHKARVYEESIRVPLEMRGPGIPQGVSISPLTINADLAPTIVQAATAASPGLVMDGRSLIPVVRHPAVDTDRELLIQGMTVKAIRTERYLYAEYDTGETELYDLQSDPFELQSLHDDPAYAPVESALADRLHNLETCAGASCRDYQPEPPAP
jgi:N-acetylglucosamine-6-sulfatase